jgi:hypothetical protein
MGSKLWPVCVKFVSWLDGETEKNHGSPQLGHLL